MDDLKLKECQEFQYKIIKGKEAVARLEKHQQKDIHIEIQGGSSIKCYLTKDEVSMLCKIISVLQKDNLAKLEEEYLNL